jgi:hypothetical protein
LDALSNGALVTVKHFSEIIYFPMRLAKGDKAHSQVPLAFDDIKKALGLHPSCVWKEGNAPDGLISLPGTPHEVDPLWAQLHHAQAHAYFHPVVRQFLFDTAEYDNDYRLAFHRTDIKKISVTLTGSSAMASTKVELKVDRCELELFRMNVAVLVLEVSATTPMGLRVAQALQDQLRRTFAPYFNDYLQDDAVDSPFGTHFSQSVELYGDAKTPICVFEALGGELEHAKKSHRDEFEKRFVTKDGAPKAKMADSIGVAKHWETLLAPLSIEARGNQIIRFVPLGDDRLPIATYLGVENLKSISRGDWVRLAYADAPGNDRLPYAQQFLENFETDVCYDRFWYRNGESTDKPSRLLNSGLVFCWVGDADDAPFFTNTKNGAHATFRHIYSRLALIAHVQKASMLAASARISELSERHSIGQATPPNYVERSKEISQFYSEFIEFTHVYWFDEISPQIQGRELFAKLQEQLGTKSLYAEVRQELTDLNLVVVAAQQAVQAEQSVKLTTYATVFGALSVATSFLAIEFFKDDKPAVAVAAGASAPKVPAYVFGKIELWAQYREIFFQLFAAAGVVFLLTMGTLLLVRSGKQFLNWLKKGRH